MKLDLFGSVSLKPNCTKIVCAFIYIYMCVCVFVICVCDICVWDICVCVLCLSLSLSLSLSVRKHFCLGVTNKNHPLIKIEIWMRMFCNETCINTKGIFGIPTMLDIFKVCQWIKDLKWRDWQCFDSLRKFIITVFYQV